MLKICSDIEFANAADTAEISRLSRRCVEQGLRPRYTRERVRKLMHDSSKNVVVARKSRVLLGFGVMTYRLDSANLDLLAVKKPYRQRGVGKQILQWLEKVAHTAGIANIFVQVRESNAAALEFYNRLGYQIVDFVPGYYQGRDSALILCRGLRPMVTGARAPDPKNLAGKRAPIPLLAYKGARFRLASPSRPENSARRGKSGTDSD